MRKNRRMQRLAIVATVAVTVTGSALFNGCGTQGGQADATKSTKRTESAKSNETRIFTDSLGRQVEVPVEIDRMIPSGDLAQQFLFAIAPDKLIACSGGWTLDAEQYLAPQYLALQDVGSFFGSHNLNYEEVAKLNPQIIIDVGETKDSMDESLDQITEKTGIPVVHIQADLDSVADAFLMLGDLLGEEEQGQALHDFCEDAYEKTSQVMEAVDQDGARKTLLYCLGENGMNVLAKDSYQSQIIDMVSDNQAVVASPSAKGSGNETDIEQILNWNPEVIIFAPDGYYDYVAEDNVWQPLQAIQAGTYYEVPQGPYNWMGFPPGSNRILGLLWLTDLLYPEYTDYDIKEEVQTYYRLFYYCNLSDGQYEELVGRSILK